MLQPAARSVAFTLVAMASLLCIAARPCPAQTVQLPTYRVFSTNSSVLVPDRGATYLGGNTVRRAGANRVGLPVLGRLGRPLQNAAFGSELRGSHSWVRAEIIDHREWDAAVLEQARQRRQARNSDTAAVNWAVEREAAFLSQHVGRAAAGLEANRQAVAQNQQRRAAVDDQPLRLGSSTVPLSPQKN